MAERGYEQMVLENIYTDSLRIAVQRSKMLYPLTQRVESPEN
ncbi:hypothetical protein SPLC1_S220340 [Arthrospira platensis C1]|uniref:Uncharacterized protein n=1 Tax=Limnospira indica PCC 8005 TaxID=376219 RepID=A0A9P1P1K3_9CYAN|nr:hypothetical protein SPLC1_S220340 [Arthrospira platensis C1]CDM97809.1 conserved protein of unknown function [Limnospira indica PCC 8005]